MIKMYIIRKQSYLGGAACVEIRRVRLSCNKEGREVCRRMRKPRANSPGNQDYSVHET